jgi:hypothetical protein
MNTPSFGVKELKDFKIEVVHLHEGHSYIMLISKDKDGRRFLNGTASFNRAFAKNEAVRFRADARRFAETAARKAGKID